MNKETDLFKRFDSTDKNVFKYVFNFSDAIAETVLYRYPSFEERTVICCSVQSGCPIGCKFCGSGGKFIRNLNSAEITSQIEKVLNDHNINTSSIKKFQIMFMSMGEPLLNWTHLKQAIIDLNAKYPNAQLLISTVAPKSAADNWVALLDLSKRIEKIGVQFSIHESTEEKRAELIPFKNKLSLKEIATLGHMFKITTGRRPFFNYCVHENNSKNDDVKRLKKYFDPEVWEATISVICEKDESIKRSQERQENLLNKFYQLMQDENFSCRRFNPAGQDDIGGGCGQLWYVQQWMKAHQSKKDTTTHQHLESKNND